MPGGVEPEGLSGQAKQTGVALACRIGVLREVDGHHTVEGDAPQLIHAKAPSIELHRIPCKRRQGRLQGFGVGHAGGIQHGGLGAQALQFGTMTGDANLLGPDQYPGLIDKQPSGRILTQRVNRQKPNRHPLLLTAPGSTWCRWHGQMDGRVMLAMTIRCIIASVARQSMTEPQTTWCLNSYEFNSYLRK